MVRDILLLDNNAIFRLANPVLQRRLKANLRTTGREFWPSGVNTLEALKSRDHETRTRLLITLRELAGNNHALPLPTEALRTIAEALASGAQNIEWSDSRLTILFREPESVSDDLAAAVRRHLIAEKERFTAAHDAAKDELMPRLKELGGRQRWPNVRAFLDEVWNSEEHLHSYLYLLWERWGLPGDAPVKELLRHRAWRLYFEGWGAAMYARTIAHPQPPAVQYSDLVQLVYFGSARSALIASDDLGFQQLGNEVLRACHPLTQVVPLDSLLS